MKVQLVANERMLGAGICQSFGICAAEETLPRRLHRLFHLKLHEEVNH